MDFIIDLDTRLFEAINGWHSEGFDTIMVWVSGKTTWWPFYLAILLYLSWFRRWQTIMIVLFIALCITLTDQVSVHLFKETIMRLRPCHNPDLMETVHLVNGKCGGLYGFVSSHAANSFGVAMLLSLIERRWWFTVVMMFWATLIGYSRIYLGVHYPGDVIGGALLGLLVGYLVCLLFRWLIPKLPKNWNMYHENVPGT